MVIHISLTTDKRVIEEGRALVLASIKSDLAGVKFEMQRLQNSLQELIAQELGDTVLLTSAFTGTGIKKISAGGA